MEKVKGQGTGGGGQGWKMDVERGGGVSNQYISLALRKIKYFSLFQELFEIFLLHFA